MKQSTIALLVLSAAAGSLWAQAGKRSLEALYDGKEYLPAADSFPIAVAPYGSDPPFVLRSEHREAVPAGRYSLDLEQVPSAHRRMIAGWDKLRHNNLNPTKDWVDEVNRTIRARNAGRTRGLIPKWKFDMSRGSRYPDTANCLAYAASTAHEWWALQLGRPLPAYRNMVSGRFEEGLDPTMLELKYLERAADPPPSYDRYYVAITVPEIVGYNPVRPGATTAQPRGYAELLTEERPYTVEDPFSGTVYRYTPEQGAMERRHLELFATPMGLRTPDKYARILAEALRKWGIAYIQLAEPRFPRLLGVHAATVVGYFCMEPTGESRQAPRFFDCSKNPSDEDWARTAYFILHDTFGDFPATHISDLEGSSAYRGQPIASIDKAYVFPHGLRVTAEPALAQPGAWRVRVANNGGKAPRAASLSVLGADGLWTTRSRSDAGEDFLVFGSAGEQLRVYIEAEHYFEADGRGREFLLGLEPASKTSGVELERTPRSPSYRERLAAAKAAAAAQKSIQSP